MLIKIGTISKHKNGKILAINGNIAHSQIILLILKYHQIHLILRLFYENRPISH
ncbi:hypothetical protein [Moraxella lacunata]|uniref:hypothetical protein n=1 Tax=Moraxella lacunata TaxID=477 RepID=UPI003EE1E0C1